MRPLNQAQRLAVEDRVIAALKEHGLASTGELRKLSGPHYEVFYHTCRCRCGELSHRVTDNEVHDVTRWAAPLILGICKKLERRGLVLRITPPQGSNNGGGYQWLWIGE